MVYGIKWAIKNSVFTHLFSGPKYLMELRRALYPEDDAAMPRLRRKARWSAVSTTISGWMRLRVGQNQVRREGGGLMERRVLREN